MAEIADVQKDLIEARAMAGSQCEMLVASLIRLGRLISRAEKAVDRANWDQWLHDTLRMTPRLAARYAQLSADTVKPVDLASRVILGALNMNLSDEIVLPDADHIVKATDMQNRTLYMWPADKACDSIFVIAFDVPGSPAFECCMKPIETKTAKDFLTGVTPAGFNFGNADYQILPALPAEIARYNDMLERHQEKALRFKDQREKAANGDDKMRAGKA